MKDRPNHARYIAILRGMTPAARLAKAFELSEMAKSLFFQGLRRRFPHLPEDDLRRLYLERLDRCHNRSW